MLRRVAYVFVTVLFASVAAAAPASASTTSLNGHIYCC
jgi:hypothetical protein